MKTHARYAHDARSMGFTLVELLIVIAIIGLLVQMILPAVMASQESARQLSCSNNLRQIALGLQLHDEAHKRLPSGGWHYSWVGEPERGTGPEQPGGWIFNILDFVEQRQLRSMGAGLRGEDRAAALRTRIETPVPLFSCPSRRLPRALPVEWQPQFYSRGGPIEQPLIKGAKTDFAACSGSIMEIQDFYPLIAAGKWVPPTSLEAGDDPALLWPGEPEFNRANQVEIHFNGLIYAHSKIENRQVTDGLSTTYLVGEKCVTNTLYKTGTDLGDNEHMYAGFDNDMQRTAFASPVRDSEQDWHTTQFGSVHPTTWNMAFGDGSVHPVSFDIYLEVHRRLAGRDDEKPVSLEEL